MLNLGLGVGLGGGSLRPPLAAGVKLVNLGNSITMYSNQASGAADVRNQACSELHWALWRMGAMGHPVKNQIWADAAATSAYYVPTYAEACAANPLFRGGNFGLAGDTATGATRRLNMANNTGADVWLYNIGTNVGSLDNDPNVVIARHLDVINYAKSNNRKLIIGTIRPRSVALIGASWRDRNVTINDWIRANALAAGASAIADPWEDLRNPAFPPGNPMYGDDLPGVTRDGVHLTPLGAWLSSKSTMAALKKVVGPGSWFNTNPTVANLWNNPTFTGATGSPSGGAVGVLPTGVNVIGPGTGNVTITCSLEPNPATGGQTIILDIASDGLGAMLSTRIFNVSFTNPTTGFISTDYVQGYLDMEVYAQSASTLVSAFQSTMGQASTVVARGLGQAVSLVTYGGQPFPDEALGRGFVATEPVVVGALTALNHRLNIAVRADVNGTRRMRIYSNIIRVVPSPVTEFPFIP